MPPKGKAKADAGTPQQSQRGGAAEDRPIEVPLPPPTAVCMPLPEHLINKYGTARCLLLTWYDPDRTYKVQVRGWTPGESADKALAESDWKDTKELERVRFVGRKDAYEARIYACEQVRLQYRLVFASGPKTIEDRFVANWWSMPSEPVASYVDPPVGLEAELTYESDVIAAAVSLKWKSCNMRWFRQMMSDAGAFGSWPSLLPVKLQVRWRVLRSLPSVDEALPSYLAEGKYHVSAALDNISKDAAFKTDDETWYYTYKEAVEGVVASFSVRVGTAYRWSAWSEESPEITLEVPEPRPPGLSKENSGDFGGLGLGDELLAASVSQDDVEAGATEDLHFEEKQELEQAQNQEEDIGQSPSFDSEPGQQLQRSMQGVVDCIEIRHLTDSGADAVWMPFSTEENLKWVEYQVTLCMIDGPDSQPDWDNNGIVVGTVVHKIWGQEVTAPIHGLRSSCWYRVQVDARYPNVGKRNFSDSKATSPPFRTPFPPRPPLQPLPYLLDLDEELPLSEDESPPPAMRTPEPVAVASEDAKEEENEQRDEDDRRSREAAKNYRWAGNAWVSLRVEKGCVNQSYCVEYKAATDGGEEMTGEHFEGWQKPLHVQRMPDVHSGEQWEVIRVAFDENCPEAVMCRLFTKTPVDQLSPLQWSVSSPPLVPYFEPPEIGDLESGACRLMPSVGGGLHLALRFFLLPGPVKMEGHLSSSAKKASSFRRETAAGHRFVTHCQVRVCFSETSWKPLALPPQSLPPASPSHSVVDKADSPGELKTAEEVLVAGLIGWMGTRHELEVDISDKTLRSFLLADKDLQVSLRVGNAHRWSCWTAWSAPQSLVIPTPEPPPGAGGADPKFTVIAKSPTSMEVAFPAFDRLPIVTYLEYVITAQPIFSEVEEGAGAGPPTEGPGSVQTVTCFQNEPRKSDDQLVLTREVTRLLEKDSVAMSKVAACMRDVRQAELDKEADKELKVALNGLLPHTRYLVSVAARYPAAAGAFPASMLVPPENPTHGYDGLGMILGQCLKTEAETPGGDAPPVAPRQVGRMDAPSLADLEDPEDDFLKPGMRSALLMIEDRSDYALEYRACASICAHYDPEVGAGLKDFGGSWGRKGGEEYGWKRVSGVRRIEKSVDEVIDKKKIVAGSTPAHEEIIVEALLPLFAPQAGQAQKLLQPDVVRFRQCAIDRSATHPCRWIGGVSEPVAIAFAPPRRAPKVHRILSDDRWCLSISFEVFKHVSPPYPVRLLGGGSGQQEDVDDDDDDSEDEEEQNDDLAELRESNCLPTPPKESWAQSDLRHTPVGYGHRMVTMVQYRFSLQSGTSPLMRREIEKKVLSRAWQHAPPIEITKQLQGAQTSFSFQIGAAVGLLDGGIYMFQIRLGNGKNWSAWSQTSKAIVFQVPTPTPPTAASLGAPRTVTVEVVSSTAARVRWGDFKPAKGLTMLEYEVRAAPELNSQSQQTMMPVTASFEHSHRGGFIEHEITNLLPFTSYRFSVHARYPRVGSRAWAGQQVSELVVLEAAAAFQDPPAPAAVPDNDVSEELELSVSAGVTATADAVACFATLEFPNEEDDMMYDLEYAHVLANELDTAEMRQIQSLWQTPLDVTMVDAGFHGNGGGRPQPRWRVRLPDIRPFRAEALKLALMQRVRFRLRAKITPEDSSSRWWSSISAPVATGFAGPEDATACLIAHGDRLTVEVQFQLDRRLAEAADQADAAELRLHRADVFKALQDDAGAPGTGDKSASWPRGFGHPFVTRYQLRVRYQMPEEDGNMGDWSAWAVHPHSALPRDLEKWELFPGTAVGSQSTRWFKAEIPQPKARSLIAGLHPVQGEIVQVSIRVGDGIKWSVWRNIREVSVAVAPPRPVREIDTAVASWKGNICTVAWPAVVPHSGLDHIEYQLTVIPESDGLLPFVGVVLVAPGASQEQAAPAGRGVLTRGKTKAFLGKTQKDLGRSGMPAKVVAGTATLISQQEAASKGGFGSGMAPDSLILELQDLCPDLRYSFQVLVRYPTIGPRSFNKIFEANKVSRVALTAEEVAAAASPGSSEGRSRLPPAPIQVPLTEVGQEMMKRWLQDGDGRIVILSWKGLEAEAENARQASVKMLDSGSFGAKSGDRHYEVQATEVSSSDFQDHAEVCREWFPVPVASCSFMYEGLPCIVLRNLPFCTGKFRLFDSKILAAGPATKPVVTVYEQVDPAPEADMVALGRGAPRTMGIQLTIPLSSAEGTTRRATRYQVRFRPVGSPSWQELDTKALNTGTNSGNPNMRSGSPAAGSRDQSRQGNSGSRPGSRQPTAENFCEKAVLLVREEDGLELGCVYEFQVRVGDRCRLGKWSRESRHLRFSIPTPVPSEGSGLKVLERDQFAELSWSPFQPQPSLAAKMPSFRHLPIEYTVMVVGGVFKEPVTSVVTRDCSVKVCGLHPNTSYSATLSARWSRFESNGQYAEGKYSDQILMAAFVTTGLGGKQLVAELSVRVPTQRIDGYGPVETATTRLPMDGMEPAGVKLNLDPYYVQPRLQHYTPDFVRRPTIPANALQAATAGGFGRDEIQHDDVEEGSVPMGTTNNLPAIVPMPPPKFTTRDPLTYSLISAPHGSKPAVARPSPRRRAAAAQP